MRKALISGAAAAVLLLVPACDWMKKKEAPQQKSEKQIAAEERERIRKACASDGTYDRLKELVFDEAARIRNSDPRNLDPLAASSVVRMEDPLVKSRDEDLNVTVCTGHFVLELPPGVENAFDGMRRLKADVEYAAQAAADGSGLVYHMDGAEPIIYRLASFGFDGKPLPRLVETQPPEEPQVAAADPALMPPVQPQPSAQRPQPQPQPPSAPSATPRPPAAPKPPAPKPEAPKPAPATQSAGARPSFSCRYAKTSTEKMVCGSPGLAAKDRQMASIYYAAMASADPATRSHLRRSRDAFLSRRERCGSETCVRAAYESRIAEIRSVIAGH